MPKLFSFLALLVAWSASAAIPSIATSTRVVAPGDTLTITGCFDTNTLDFEWQDFEDQTVGEKLLHKTQNTAGMPDGWICSVNTGDYGNYPTVTNAATYTGSNSIALTMTAGAVGDGTTGMQYLPTLDSRDPFNVVYISFNVYLDIIDQKPYSDSSGDGHGGMWKIIQVNNAERHGDSANDQEGGYYFTVTQTLPDNGGAYVDPGITSSIQSELGFQDEHRWCCCGGDLTHTCDGGSCTQLCKWMGLPGNSDPSPNFPFAKYAGYDISANLSGNPEVGNQLINRDYFENWFRLEYYWDFSDTLGTRDARHYVRFQDRTGPVPAFFQWDYDLCSHLGTLRLDSLEVQVPEVWESLGSRVNFMGHVSKRFRTSTQYYDDIMIQFGTEARVELGNAETYSQCTRFELQHPYSWENDEISMELNAGAWLPGQWKWIYVFNGDGGHNEIGVPVYLSPDQPPTTFTPHKPKNPRFDENPPEGGE